MKSKDVLFSEDSIEFKEEYLKEVDRIVNQIAKTLAFEAGKSYVGKNEMWSAITIANIIVTEKMKKYFGVDEKNEKWRTILKTGNFEKLFKILVGK